MILRREFSTFDIGVGIAALGLALAVATHSFAQGAAPAPPALQNAPAEKVEPAPAPSPPLPNATPDENLSRRLEKSDGVITPPATGDAEIHVPPKSENAGSMPVIPPPGSPGGRQDIQPK
jgi:hypothetical protein